MAKKASGERFTAAEISVLRVLWDRQPATLAEAHEELCRRGPKIGYTTAQTRLERLVEKGVVAKSSDRPARYRATVEPEEVSRPLLDLLLERVSGALPLFAHLIQDRSLTKADLAEMKRLIAQAERRQESEDER